MSSSTTDADRLVHIQRFLRAPRERVFDAWSSAASLRRWYAPQGCELSHCELDFRPLGELTMCIRTPDGHECWVQGAYLDVSRPERIVFSMRNVDAEGQAAEPEALGKDPEWPRETVVTVTFATVDGGTELTLHQSVRESVAKRTGAYPSWLQMLDHLEQELA